MYKDCGLIACQHHIHNYQLLIILYVGSMSVSACSCVCMCVWRPAVSFLGEVHFLDVIPHWDLYSLVKLGWLASKLEEFACLLLYHWAYK